MIMDAIMANAMGGGKPLAYAEVKTAVIVPEQMVDVQDNGSSAHALIVENIDMSGVTPYCTFIVKINGVECTSRLIETEDGIIGLGVLKSNDGSVVGYMIVGNEDGVPCLVCNYIGDLSGETVMFSVEAVVETVHKVKQKYLPGMTIDLIEWAYTLTDFLSDGIYCNDNIFAELVDVCKNGEPLTIRGTATFHDTPMTMFIRANPSYYSEKECVWSGALIYNYPMHFEFVLDLDTKMLTAYMASDPDEAATASEEPEA